MLHFVYEPTGHILDSKVHIGFSFVVAAFGGIWLSNGAPNYQELQILSAMAYIIGTYLDHKSTEFFVTNSDHVEGNPFLPERPTGSDLRNRRRFVIEASSLVIAIIYPPFGIAIGGSRGMASAHNWRV